MANLRNIFTFARFLGDASALEGGLSKAAWLSRMRQVGGRAQRRIEGKALSKIFRVNVWGLILWGEFFNWIRNQIMLLNARDAWVGTALIYAGVYEFKEGRPFLMPAVRQATTERTYGSRINITPLGFSRSGVYSGGRFLADIKAVRRMSASSIGMRAVRRSTGAQASRLFWGALRNPRFNVMMALAIRTQELAKINVKKQGLVRSRALLNSIEVGNTKQEVIQKSRKAAVQALLRSGQKVTAKRRKQIFGASSAVLPG